jgi:type IV secretory pathway VirB2 component (pilin)
VRDYPGNGEWIGRGEAGSIASSVEWIQDLLTGQLSVALSVLAIALLGYAMLLGRVQLAAAARVVVGCFILSGASTIATTLLATQQSGAVADPPASPPAIQWSEPPPPLPAPEATGVNPFDPYANSAPGR